MNHEARAFIRFGFAGSLGVLGIAWVAAVTYRKCGDDDLLR